MLFCKNAKYFEALPKNIFKAYHKCHISKTMGIAVAGIAFENTLENREIAFKIRFERAQTAKIAKRMTKNKNGDILRKKEDTYFADCSVTGSNY